MAGHSREVKGIVPLVCDQVWSLIFTSYPHPRLKILVEQNRPSAFLQKSSSFPFPSLCMKGEAITVNCMKHKCQVKRANDARLSGLNVDH